MYYLNNKYYNPRNGRFINCDEVKYIGQDGTNVGYSLHMEVDVIMYGIGNKTLGIHLIVVLVVQNIGRYGGKTDMKRNIYTNKISVDISDEIISFKNNILLLYCERIKNICHFSKREDVL